MPALDGASKTTWETAKDPKRSGDDQFSLAQGLPKAGRGQ
jgi:hypothetical protein